MGTENNFITTLKKALYILNPKNQTLCKLVLKYCTKVYYCEKVETVNIMHFLCCCMKETKQVRTCSWVSDSPISRAHCRRGHRLSCSTSAPRGTDHRDSSTRHTWGFPEAERSDPASLKSQRQKYTQLRHSWANVNTLTWSHKHNRKRILLLCSHLTCVWCNALMSASIVAAFLITGAVTVIRAIFSTHPCTPVPARTHSWLCCRDREINIYKEG